VTHADRRKKTRAERLSMPLARDVVMDLAVEHGACVRPIQLRRTDLTTGETEPVLVPCGHTLASVCPSCAERAKNLRAAQCREGWHLDQEPVIEPDDPSDDQKWLIQTRADAQAMRDADEARGEDVDGWDDELADLDEQINDAGMRGNVLPKRAERRHRSTRRRQDAPPLPKRAVDPRTVGKTYTTPDGKTFRPSLFVTLTCPSYGRVKADGTPVDPDAYDYTAAARDALHLAALFDRCTVICTKSASLIMSLRVEIDDRGGRSGSSPSADGGPSSDPARRVGRAGRAAESSVRACRRRRCRGGAGQRVPAGAGTGRLQRAYVP
jgi:hypothetical protein